MLLSIQDLIDSGNEDIEYIKTLNMLTNTNIALDELQTINTLSKFKLPSEIQGDILFDVPGNENLTILTDFIADVIKKAFVLIVKIVKQIIRYLEIFWKTNDIVERSAFSFIDKELRYFYHKYQKLSNEDKKKFDSHFTTTPILEVYSANKLLQMQTNYTTFCNYFKDHSKTFIEDIINNIESKNFANEDNTMKFIGPTEYKLMISLGIEYKKDRYVFELVTPKQQETYSQLGYINVEKIIQVFTDFKSNTWRSFRELAPLIKAIMNWEDKLEKKKQSILQLNSLDKDLILNNIKYVDEYLKDSVQIIKQLRECSVFFITQGQRLINTADPIFDRIGI